MTSMLISALTNAGAFVGMGYLFRKLDKKGYEEETKRHNQATEELARARDAWNKKNVERKNKIEEKRRELDNANADINTTNKALDNLGVVLKRQIKKLELEETPEPTLNDFYESSDEADGYRMIGVGIVGAVGGFAGYEAYKYFWKTKRTKRS